MSIFQANVCFNVFLGLVTGKVWDFTGFCHVDGIWMDRNLYIYIQACSLLDSLLEFKLAVIFCCEPSHGLHDHPPPTPCTQFNESGRRFFYIK